MNGNVSFQIPNSELPRGWRWVKLGEVCELIMGQSPPGNTYTVKPEGLPFFQGKADFGEYFPTVRIWCNHPIKIAEEGDILIAVRAPVGPVNMNNLKCCVGRGLTGIRCKDNIAINWFIFWYLRSIEKQIASLGSGSTFGAITRDDLVNLEIPLPPLGEQMRIAAKNQELMQEVERARTACKKQLEAAKVLTAAYLREVFESEEAKKWEKKSLGEVCELITDGTHRTPLYVKRGIPFLSVKNVKESNLDFKDVQYISEEEHKELIKRCHPRKGDVLYTKVGTTGIAKAVDTEREFSIFVSVALLRPDRGKVTPECLEKILNSSICRQQAKALTQGVGNQNLVIKDLKRIEFPLPPIEKQRQIAFFLKEKMTEIENLQFTIQNQQSALNALPQSILRQAFNGEL